MKKAFTLAEVLITLSIIGVVAALTIPSLIAKYQKHVLYNQFMKAASVLENAVKMYEADNGCVGDIIKCTPYLKATDIIKYFNISQEINNDNYEQICKVYIRDDDVINPCSNDFGRNGTYAFITNDGVFFGFGTDGGYGNGSFVDVNGLKKPNELGRDIFIFYTPLESYNTNQNITYTQNDKIIWGGQESKLYSPYGTLSDEVCSATDINQRFGCANKLFLEHKMNY